MRHGWSTDEDHWDELESFVLKYKDLISWSHTQATLKLSHNIPDSPGVYSFNVYRDFSIDNEKNKYPYLFDDLDSSYNSLYSSIYIGMSDNLQRRFKEHLIENPKIINAINTFAKSGRKSLIYSWTEFPKVLTREYEDKLIKVFGPTLNMQN